MATKRTASEYFESFDSRYGYRLVLGGTKHFGRYRPGDSPYAFSDAMRRMEDLLAMTIDLPVGSLLLDAGCGAGDVARRLSGVHGYRVTGIDLLAFDIDEAKRRAKRDHLSTTTEFSVMSYDDLDFKPGAFDGVYTMETLVHAVRAETTLAEFFRVLRPGGKLVLFEYSHDADLTKSEMAALTRVNDLASMPSFQRFEVGLLESLLIDTGFSEVRSNEITEQMEPMFRGFAKMARVPYALSRFIGKPDLFVNAMSAAELWKVRNVLHYNIYVAIKPDPSSSTVA